MFIGVGTLYTISFECQNTIVIGRSDSSDENKPGLDLSPFRARDAGVSRHHAAIFAGEKGLQIRDLGSTNGTRINGYELDASRVYKVCDGDEIEFGQLRTVLHIINAPD
jgi:pSer/pThr/pTyr-binding forkhead associated (FHA) protein